MIDWNDSQRLRPEPAEAHHGHREVIAQASSVRADGGKLGFAIVRGQCRPALSGHVGRWQQGGKEEAAVVMTLDPNNHLPRSR
jgi:hypothetical protein